MRERTIMDYPTINMSQAAIFFNMGRAQFRRRFFECMTDEIRWCESNIGRRLLLIDVIKAAYPEISNDKAHEIAIDFCHKTAEEREESGIQRVENRIAELHG